MSARFTSQIENQENKFLAPPKAKELRAPPASNAGPKRPLSAKGDNNKRQRVPLTEKPLRVPLAGKHVNAPALARSQSSVVYTPGSNQQAAPVLQIAAKRPAPLLARAPPLLPRANSTLALVRPPAALYPNVPAPLPYAGTNPVQNDNFPAAQAARPRDLVPLFATDSVKKPLAEPLPPLQTALRDTFSENTRRLHALQLPPPSKSYFNTDPAKAGAISIRTRDDLALIEALARDEDSVEITPNPVPPLPESVTLSAPDLDKYLSAEPGLDDSDYDLDAAAITGPGAEPLGLTASDLNDLLEF